MTLIGGGYGEAGGHIKRWELTPVYPQQFEHCYSLNECDCEAESKEYFTFYLNRHLIIDTMHSLFQLILPLTELCDFVYRRLMNIIISTLEVKCTNVECCS